MALIPFLLSAGKGRIAPGQFDSHKVRDRNTIIDSGIVYKMPMLCMLVLHARDLEENSRVKTCKVYLDYELGSVNDEGA